MNNREVEHFFHQLQVNSGFEIIIVIDTCSFIKYHEAIASFLPIFHHARNDLKFYIPWVVHQELDTMKGKRSHNDQWDPQSIHSAVNAMSTLLDLSCGHSNLAYTFQSSNDAANAAAANLPHCANDDDILLSALFLCHNNLDGLRRVYVWTDDRILVNKIRVSGLSAISQRDDKLVILGPPPIGAQLGSSETQDLQAVTRHVVTPPDDDVHETQAGVYQASGSQRSQTPSDMAVDSPDEDLNLDHCLKEPSRLPATMKFNPPPARFQYQRPAPAATLEPFVASFKGRNPTMDNINNWNDPGDGIVPRYLQRAPSSGNDRFASRSSYPVNHSNPSPYVVAPVLIPQNGRASQIDSAADMMTWDVEEPRSQSAIPSMSNYDGQRSLGGSYSQFPHQQHGQQSKRPSASTGKNAMLNAPGDDPLSHFLVDVVTREMVSAYGPDLVWTDICCLRSGRPPINWREAIFCIDRHWIAVFKHVFGTAKVVTNARETILKYSRSINAPVEEITTAARVLANYIATHPVHSAAARGFLRSVPFIAGNNAVSSPIPSAAPTMQNRFS